MTVIKSAKLYGGGIGKDPNDLRDHPELIKQALRIAESANLRGEKPDRFAAMAPRPPPREALVIADDEWQSAKLTPKCIVEGHLYADVAQRVAPGGTGKTTLALWEAVHIVLGIDLYGAKVVTPGWVLYVTAEDPRERLVARLKKICEDMVLTPEQTEKVKRGVLFWDLTGQPAKLAMEADGNILATPLAEEIVDQFKDDPPVLVEFDPAVSFGAAESRVNDNEQALVLAARMIVKGLDCCVRYTHHTGKTNARDRTADQYSGRGGSAMPDGCRMVQVLQTWSATDQTGPQPPPILYIGRETSVIRYSRPKVSHCPPNQPAIWIARTGFTYEWALEHNQSPEDRERSQAEQLLQFLRHETKQRRYYTANQLDTQAEKLQMTRKALRCSLHYLESRGMVLDDPLPANQRKGKRQTFVCPADLVGKVAPEESAGNATETPKCGF